MTDPKHSQESKDHAKEEREEIVIETYELRRREDTYLTKPTTTLANFDSTGISIFDAEYQAHSAKDVLAEWLADRKESTLKTYEAAMTQFAKFANEPNMRAAAEKLVISNPDQFHAIMKKWMQGQKAAGLKAATIEVRLRAIGSYMNLAKKLGLVDWNPVLPKIKRNRNKGAKDTSPVPAEDVRLMLLAAANRRDIIGARNFSALLFMLCLALRRMEVFHLLMSDYEPKKKRVFILGKARDEKEPWPLGIASQYFLDEWLEHRGDADGAIFCSFHSAKIYHAMHLNSVNKIFTDLAAEAGIDSVTPHRWGRHTPASIGVTLSDPIAVQEWLRHGDIRTTQNYLHAMDDKRVELSDGVADHLGLPNLVAPGFIKNHFSSHKSKQSDTTPKNGGPEDVYY